MTTEAAAPATVGLKLTCQQRDLLDGLKLVGRAIEARSTLPVLNHVLLRATDGLLSLTGTNLELAIRVVVEANAEGEGAVTLPAKTLTDLVASLPDERMELAAASGKPSVTLTCGRF